jgi:hypothetical protein
MNIRILHGIQGAAQAQGLCVVIDVFRAFSLECYLVQQGAAEIDPVGSLERAFQLKREHPQAVLDRRARRRPRGRLRLRQFAVLVPGSGSDREDWSSTPPAPARRASPMPCMHRRS